MVTLESLDGDVTAAELSASVSHSDLIRLTEEICELQARLVADVEDPDVAFLPEDPEAEDRYAATEAERHVAWTLGHVVAHATASSEEAAALGLTLARGLPVEGRSRKEVSWQNLRTAPQLRERVRESCRMRVAMLLAWPERPDLEITQEFGGRRPPVNAVGRVLLGLQHDHSHLAQIREILRQARLARVAG